MPVGWLMLVAHALAHHNSLTTTSKIHPLTKPIHAGPPSAICRPTYYTLPRTRHVNLPPHRGPRTRRPIAICPVRCTDDLRLINDMVISPNDIEIASMRIKRNYYRHVSRDTYSISHRSSLNPNQKVNYSFEQPQMTGGVTIMKCPLNSQKFADLFFAVRKHFCRRRTCYRRIHT